jgi:hypothetical protein
MAGGEARMFDLKGRLVSSAAGSNAASRSLLLVIVPQGKQAYVRPVVKQ